MIHSALLVLTAGLPQAGLSSPQAAVSMGPSQAAPALVQDLRRVLPDGTVQRTVIRPGGIQLSGPEFDRERAETFASALEERGRLAPTLAAWLAEQPADAPVEVAFWLHDNHSAGAPLELLRQTSPEAIRDARRELLALATATHSTRVERFAATVRETGGDVLVAGLGAPLVVATVRADRVAELALHPDVDEAYRSMPAWLDEGEFAQGTMRTPVVWNQGITAANSPVRMLINDTSDVVTDNPFLPPVTLLGSTGSAFFHANAVAGNVANGHPLHAAAARDLPQLYSYGGTGDLQAPTIWNTAIASGIDFGNCSWWNGQKGQIEFLDRYFDYIIRNFGVMMFKSVGNQGGTSEPFATTPGNGFNMLSSAHSDDLNTFDPSDDLMNSDASWWDPIEGHAKPEVTSPGSGVATTTSEPDWITPFFSGSSSASPLVAGVATLIASGEPLLLAQPTTVKAVLMASAWNNVEGDSLLSDRDGAGSVHAAAAWSVVRDGQWWFDDVIASDFQGGVLDVPMSLLAGDQTRVCALWQSNPNSAFTTDVLEMDLDLAVLDPFGNVVASSTSTVNAFELSGFTPQFTGTYTVRLTRQRFDGITEPLTVTWTSRSDAAQAELVHDASFSPFAVDNVVLLRLAEAYQGSGRAYAITSSATPPAGLPLYGGFTLPTGVDALTLALLNAPAMIGVLDFFGDAVAPIAIPAKPSLIGVDLYFGATVFGGALLDIMDIQAVSNTLELTIGP